MSSSLQDRLLAELAHPEDDGPVGRAVDAMLGDATAAGVSDVHLNPTGGGLDILYRIDGVLQPRASVGRNWAERFVGRVKVLSSLLTYRRDIPQDGQIPAAQAGGRTDVRVSVFPTLQGEKAVLRFFLNGRDRFELYGLGHESAVAAALRRAVAKPDGVVLLTGPSGSGKTTSIYSLINEILRSPGPAMRHVVTIEDPVEQALPGVTQTQVNPAAGLDFAASLRSLLRQDPQVIMVGEIRDRETARVAFEAGLTGHLVISTVHAGTAAGVVARLLEIGVEEHVLTTALTCVLAQRLVRRRCPKCKGGCADCGGMGYSGRQVFGELLLVDDEIRSAITEHRPRAAVEELAIGGGMVPLRRAGEKLVAGGVTTAEELRRVLG